MSANPIRQTVSGETPQVGRTIWDVALSLLVGRRRCFVIDRRYQLRVGVLALGVVLVLLVLVNASIYFTESASTSAVLETLPEVSERLQSRDRFQFAIVLASSIVFAAGVFLLAILRSHRTAGPAFNLSRCMRRVAEGDYVVRARFRSDDNLQELAEAFNEMTRSLRQRTHAEIDELSALASRLETLAPEPETRELAKRLRRLVKKKRERTGGESAA